MKNALTSLYNGSLTSKREQTILTPEWILGAVHAVAPIYLDPCTTIANPVDATKFYTEADNGLVQQWIVPGSQFSVFVNPPYANLQAWLAKALIEDATRQTRMYYLVPVRTQRPWFGRALRSATGCQFLKAFAFKGYDQVFPAPMCLMRWNGPAADLPESAVTWSI